MEIAKVLVVVKTYPCRSKKYVETVCTAGFREDGSWIRLYPVPFRLTDKHYVKFQWIEAKIEKNPSDNRPESYRIVDVPHINLLEKIKANPEDGWLERRNIIFQNQRIYTNLKEIIDLAHKNILSLVIFKPKRFIELVIKNVEYTSKERLELQKSLVEQNDLFVGAQKEAKKLMPALSKKFYYVFEDDEGRQSKLMIEDWEIGQLYLKCRANSSNDEEAIQKVRQQYWEKFVGRKDLYLFLGTTAQWHNMNVPNPFVIIGVFYPPIVKQPLEKQLSLF